MRMVSRLQLIYHQVHSTLRNPTFQFERSPFNDSKMICFGELNLNLHTLQDLCSEMQTKNSLHRRRFGFHSIRRSSSRLSFTVFRRPVFCFPSQLYPLIRKMASSSSLDEELNDDVSVPGRLPGTSIFGGAAT
ncbi:hypothetical protein LINGRAHAP2_LOCUS16092 [Linum grandiflorum]